MPKGKTLKESAGVSARLATADTRPHVEILREQWLKRHDPASVLPEDERLSLEWSNITYKVPIIKRSFGREVSRTEKTILRDVSGFVPAGSLVGILGPSGAGKTTFLNVLSRQLRSHTKISGEITVNGVHASRGQFQRLSGFVAQDDVLMGAMTAEEALMFAARLKLPNSVPEEEQIATARSLLKNLGLEHVKDKLIGYTGAAATNSGLARGLSGGERKRVSICFEMVSNPKILFLDEPTSGLDSFAAKTVVENLRDLAFYGRTIVATIHSPSAEIFRMFDYLLLLAEGQTVFFGPAHQAIQHFSSLGLTPPPKMNPADFLLKATHVHTTSTAANAGSDSSSDSDVDMDDLEAIRGASATGLRAATHEQVQKLIDGYRASQYAKDVSIKLGIDWDPNGDATTEKAKKKKHKRKESQNTQEGASTEAMAVDDSKGYEAGYWKQFRLLVHRAAVNTMREPALLRAKAFQALSIAIFAGLIWLRLKKTDSGAADRFSAIFFVLTSATFGAINGPIFVFPSERAVFFREKSSNMYSTLLYYLAVFVVELPSNIIFPIISTTIMYWMVGFNDHVVPWLIMCGFTILLNIVGHGLGMMLSCLILDTGIVVKVQPLVILPLMLFSGFFLNSDSIPKYFIWLEALSFLKYAFRACCVAVFSLGQKMVFSCPTDVCRFSNGHDVLVFLDQLGHPIYVDALILIGLAVGIHLIAIIALHIHVRRL